VSGNILLTGCSHFGNAAVEKKVPDNKNWGKVIIFDSGGTLVSLRHAKLNEAKSHKYHLTY
jgi:hypothetical protein